MNITSLIELDETANNRIEFLLLNLQDMLAKELRLDDNDFIIKNGELIYKDTIKITPNIGKHTVNITANDITDVSINYATIIDRFREWH